MRLLAVKAHSSYLNMKEKLEIPCSYQGGKQRLAKQIVDIFYSENIIDDNTKFFDLCCGSGAISLELINRGFNPNNITMIDNGCYGQFWQDIANDEFDLNDFRSEIDKIPSPIKIDSYLKELSARQINQDHLSYHYLLLQAGAFGSKQVYIEGNKWIIPGFRKYWMPTETSNRKSPVNPMMPMPETIYERVENIVNQISGCIIACKENIHKSILRIDEERKNGNKNVIVYIDPPYLNTTGYKDKFDVNEIRKKIWGKIPVYISEGYKMEGSKAAHLLTKGRKKGNISGEAQKKPVEEWLNIF